MQFRSEEDRYIISRWMYGIGAPIMSDAEYTLLHALMQKRNTLPDYTNRSWSSDPCPRALLIAYNLGEYAIDIMNTSRTESIASLGSELDVEREFRDMHERHVVSYKHDGFSIIGYYHNGYPIGARSRGRLTDAIDFSAAVNVMPKQIDRLGTVGVIGELTLTKDAFTALTIMFPEKNLISNRSAVRTALVNPAAHHLLSFTAFDVEDCDDMDEIIPFLNRNGFNTPCFREVDNYQDLMYQLKELDNGYKAYPYPTDGAVVRTVKGSWKKAIRIWSWEEPILSSFVEGYRETFNRMRIPMQVRIFPIRREGAIQRRVNVTNLSRVISNNLFIGSPICFSIKSAANADLEEQATRVMQEMYAGRFEAYQQYIREREDVRMK